MEKYLEEKTKGFSRSLYQLTPKKPDHKANDNQYLGQAALRDQKIGNALRTIDTWYPLFEENDKKTSLDDFWKLIRTYLGPPVDF